ncbi:hypothetical protein U9M48_018002 [Paspalum notatum var. saurae]|uniref:Uncharacterized protein n=1 Tax=Paspalum notatum var. saurae TaxID=547442 RepID=A0AAQ3TAL9_PASNO
MNGHHATLPATNPNLSPAFTRGSWAKCLPLPVAPGQRPGYPTGHPIIPTRTPRPASGILAWLAPAHAPSPAGSPPGLPALPRRPGLPLLAINCCVRRRADAERRIHIRWVADRTTDGPPATKKPILASCAQPCPVLLCGDPFCVRPPPGRAPPLPPSCAAPTRRSQPLPSCAHRRPPHGADTAGAPSLAARAANTRRGRPAGARPRPPACNRPAQPSPGAARRCPRSRARTGGHRTVRTQPPPRPWLPAPPVPGAAGRPAPAPVLLRATGRRHHSPAPTGTCAGVATVRRRHSPAPTPPSATVARHGQPVPAPCPPARTAQPLAGAATARRPAWRVKVGAAEQAARPPSCDAQLQQPQRRWTVDNKSIADADSVIVQRI